MLQLQFNPDVTPHQDLFLQLVTLYSILYNAWWNSEHRKEISIFLCPQTELWLNPRDKPQKGQNQTEITSNFHVLCCSIISTCRNDEKKGGLPTINFLPTMKSYLQLCLATKCWGDLCV